MSDPLNPYPGNLRRHEVQHVTDVELGVIGSRASTDWELMTMVRDEYEAKVAKDAELIQRLVDALDSIVQQRTSCGDPDSECPLHNVGKTWHPASSAIAAAEAEGFKPTEQ